MPGGAHCRCLPSSGGGKQRSSKQWEVRPIYFVAVSFLHDEWQTRNSTLGNLKYERISSPSSYTQARYIAAELHFTIMAQILDIFSAITFHDVRST
jgi:hypothetical protein